MTMPTARLMPEELVTAEDVRNVFRSEWNSKDAKPWQLSNAAGPPSAEYTGQPDRIDYIAQRINVYRAHHARIRAAGEYVRVGQDAATNLRDVLPHWIALAHPEEVEVLTRLRDALEAARCAIGNAPNGRPGAAWMVYAPELMGLINGALGQQHREAARCARIFCVLCGRIFGPDFDLNPERVLRQMRKWKSKEPRLGHRHFQLGG
jgi:hypothetical protein